MIDKEIFMYGRPILWQVYHYAEFIKNIQAVS
jgi:hypothetical protein